MDNKEIKTIKEAILTLTEKIGVKLEEVVFNDCSYYGIGEEKLPEHAFSINIKTQEPGILIGSRGGNLSALQHLARLIIRAKLSRPVYFILDVNGYKVQKIGTLKRIAEDTAKIVGRTGRTFILQPMRAYDRRVIHLSLASRSDVTTVSEGEEPERRVAIRPV